MAEYAVGDKITYRAVQKPVPGVHREVVPDVVEGTVTEVVKRDGRVDHYIVDGADVDGRTEMTRATTVRPDQIHDMTFPQD
ncbi:hypothetical protein [Streptomyces sp. NPDC048349]|uniref:hypothetical protein n=1 Tax=Streptomyces sp. NPDC048349 TaxID=3155486 RepID=UPI003432031D